MLRVRLILWYSLLVLLTIAAIGFAQNVIIHRSLTQALDSSLVEDARATLSLMGGLPQDVDASRVIERGQHKLGGSLRDIIDQVLTQAPDTLRGSELTDRVLSRLIDEVLAELSFQDSTGRTIDPLDAIVKRTISGRRNTMVEIHLRDAGVHPALPIFFRTENVGRDTIYAAIRRARLAEPDTAASLGELRMRGERLRVARASSPRFLVYTAYPVADIDESLTRIQWSFLYLIPLSILVSTLGGLWLARKALRPIEQIADAAREISARKLSQRIKLPGKSDRELKTLTETLNSMFARLEDSFKQVTQFTSDASHELKTPLAIMKGEIEQTRRHLEGAQGLAPNEAHEVLESLMEEVERMQRIVEGLLLLSRADDRRLPLAKERVNICEYLESLAMDAEILAEERELTLQTAFAPAEEKMFVMADPVRLYQVVMNLLDNALKYTPKGGVVTLFLERRGDSAVFGVQDTGIGIGKDDLSRIFQRFFRTDAARSGPHDDSERSLGLGLAIVKSIVQAHDGTIDVTSEPGKGTRFTIVLPLA